MSFLNNMQLVVTLHCERHVNTFHLMLHYLFVFYYRPFGQMIKPMIDAVHPPGGHAVFGPGSSQPPSKPANQQAPATQPPSQHNQSKPTTSQASSQSNPPTSNSASQSGSKTEAEKAVLFEEVLENVLECIYNSIAIHFKLCIIYTAKAAASSDLFLAVCVVPYIFNSDLSYLYFLASQTQLHDFESYLCIWLVLVMFKVVTYYTSKSTWE